MDGVLKCDDIKGVLLRVKSSSLDWGRRGVFFDQKATRIFVMYSISAVVGLCEAKREPGSMFAAMETPNL